MACFVTRACAWSCVRHENDGEVETTMTIASRRRSVVTTPSNALADYELLHRARNGSAPLRGAIVWPNGSGAVLLHEAFGHASEHDAAPVAWPSWLSIDAPLVSRRETFRDVPLMRMTHLIARQNNAPFALPDERIEVQLVAGGAYDPITDIVTSTSPYRLPVRSRSGVCARRSLRRSGRIGRTDSLSGGDLFARRAGVVCRVPCAGDDLGRTAMTEVYRKWGASFGMRTGS